MSNFHNPGVVTLSPRRRALADAAEKHRFWVDPYGELWFARPRSYSLPRRHPRRRSCESAPL